MDQHLNRDAGAAVYSAEVRRWYILAVFSFFSFNQCLVWFTFSSVSKDKVIDYYGSSHMDESSIALLLNWGPLLGVAMFPLQVWITQRGTTGFRHAVILGAALVFAGAAIRAIPCFCNQSFRQSFAAILLLHTGQILNAAAGPLCMGTESRLSCLWFRENERSTSTAIAVTSNALGATIGFLLGPAFVKTADELSRLLYFELAIAVVPFACCLLHYPATPARPPSAAAAAVFVRAQSDAREALHADDGFGNSIGDKVDNITFLQGLRMVVRDRHFCMLVLAAGILAGVQASWQALMLKLLKPTGLSDSTIGYLGFGNGLGGNVGSVLVGFLSDALFRRRFKQTILCCFVLLLLAVLFFRLSVPSGAHDKGLLPWSWSSLAAALAVAGFAQSATSPLLYELCAELTYPVPEGTSAGVLACLWNLMSALVIFISPLIAPAVINDIMLGTAVLVLAMVASVKEVYKRPANSL